MSTVGDSVLQLNGVIALNYLLQAPAHRSCTACTGCTLYRLYMLYRLHNPVCSSLRQIDQCKHIVQLQYLIPTGNGMISGTCMHH